VAPESIILVALTIGLTLYALLGGADFGAGVWEFNTALQATEKERKLIHGAMGPVWEANHVWLIFIIVTLFGAFPPAFAALSRALWLPLLLALVGIVFRGVAFVFHTYTEGEVRHQAMWGGVFALASTSSPFFLGACIGAVASGRLVVSANGEYTGDYLIGWINPISIFSAFFAVATCASMAAVFLTRDAQRSGESDLVELWRRRALASGVWLGVLSLVGLVLMATEAPSLWHGFQIRGWPFVVSSALTGFGSLVALRARRFTVAAAMSAATVTAVVWGWAWHNIRPSFRRK